MDKTININLGGTLFQIDEEAFGILRDYIQAINNRFRNVQGGLETIEDIESRIAEIFQSQKGIAGIITRDNVETMILTIGKPEEFDVNSDEPGKSFSATGSTGTKRLYRNPDDTVISGVCGGLGAYLNTDPVLFRVLFVIFSIFFGVGFLIYVVLWIAVPVANTESKKREMYGKAYSSAYSRHMNAGGDSNFSYNPSYSNSRSGNGLNEVLSAFGKVFFVIFRIFMIMIGVVLVITGFLAIFSFIMIFVLKLPGSFSGFDFNISYLPDLLQYIVNPSSAPWIIALTSVVFLLPMIALIYWGIKMIFWFRVKDGIFSLIALIVWVMAVAALSVLLFNEGVSFAESSSVTSQNILPKSYDIIYVVADKKIADIEFKRGLSIPEEDFNEDFRFFLIDSTDQIYMKPRLRLNITDDNVTKFEIRKSSSGRTKNEASLKSESLMYNSRFSQDTIYLDEYFKIPAGGKWTADFVNINLYVPANTILFFDRPAAKLFHDRIRIRWVENDETHSTVDYDHEPGDLAGKFWIVSQDGLKEAEKEVQKK